MKKEIIVFALCLLFVNVTNAQFEGSYVMKFESSDSKKTVSEMKYIVKGDMATQELLDKSQSKGFQKSIMNRKERSLIMLMDNNGKKMAMKNKMPDPKASAANEGAKPKITETGKTKMIEGYKCKEVIAESEESTADMWTTDELGLAMVDILGFSGRSNDPIYGNAVSLETAITNKKDHSKTIMYIKDIKKYSVPDSEFSLEGYQVMDIPAMNYPGTGNH